MQRRIYDLAAFSTVTIFTSLASAEEPYIPLSTDVVLTSPAQNTTVSPGVSISWNVSVQLTPGQSLGLAGLICTLEQSPSNPAAIALTPGTRAAGVANFDLPLGLANQTSSGASAFGGTPTGTGQSLELLQMGGLQNTLGVAGTVRGTDAVVDSNLALAAPLSMVQGTFQAPSVAGTYSVRLRDVRVLALLGVGSSGNPSLVESTSPGFVPEFSFTVAAVQCDTIDFNRNNVFPEDQDVIDFFNVLAGGPCPYPEPCDIDFNNNTVFPEDQDVIDFFNVLAGNEC